MEGYAVVLEEFGRVDTGSLAAVFRETLDMVAYDATHRARHVQGIVAEDLEREQAERIRAALAAIGRPSRLIDQRDVVPPVKPSRVVSLILNSDVLGWVVDYNAEPYWIPWSGLQVISAGVIHIHERHVRQKLESTRGERWSHDDGFPKLRTRVDIEDRDEYLADLLLQPSGEAPRAVRLRADALQYADILGSEFAFDATRNL